MRRTIITIGLATLLLLLPGCLSASKARQLLSERGLTELTLKRESPQRFSYTGRQAAGGTCAGTLSGSSCFGVTRWQLSENCFIH